MAFIGANIKVRGVVQGVGFRYWCMRQARELAVNGYASNMSDGSVEIKVEGDRGLVEEFIKIVRTGPTYSDVTDVKVEWYEQPRGFDDFNIRHGD
ncbi:MAG: acylphosphatase [Candidatus Zixiibacteriota bacterium]|nr:MAG: acylphosphatase [candidate division Zixibacteria bacterium]HDL03832.1 acylphosphatase [candidate division Zixibacteria bacterium]